MNKNTVKRRIFISNTLMILVTLGIFLIVNLGIIKVYSESIEHEFEDTAVELLGDDGLEELVETWTVKRNEFIILFLADGVLCILALVGISQAFTRNLSRHILEPLYALNDGAERVQNNNLTEDILYVGDVEFEKVCTTFNRMQGHILAEQEKNRRYEKARTDMIAGISHDLRTPLTAIKGTIKGLMDGITSTPEKQQKFLNAAYRRAGEMDTLLNQLFYLSKLETGNMPLSVQRINLTDFVADYVYGKQEVLDPSKAEVHAILEECNLYTELDPEQMQRIFDNLIENSIKYGEKEPVEIEFSLKEKEDRILLAVSDNGAGVPEEKLPHIFDEFYRVDESRNKREGNGLGLYIVKYLVEAMQGNVHAENRNGLVIFMDFPLKGRERMEQNGKQEKNSDH